MTAAEFQARLIARIPAEDWRRLAEDDPCLVISRWNRETLLSMRDHAPGEHPVDEARAKQLEAALETYLNRYMAKRPEGHRWIVLSCLFLAFVARAPLHPGELLGHRRVGGAVLCPAREDSPDSLCRFCVCEREDQRLG